jgi:predicted MFS family arabinose efflux permease
MIIAEKHVGPLDGPTGRYQHWHPVYAVGLATFAVVTTEMLPVGLLTPIATALQILPGTAGLMISVPAVLAAFFAPLVVLAAGDLDRKLILAGLLGLLTLANLVSAMAVSFVWLLGARIIVGFCMGGIWAIAGGLGHRLVPDHAAGAATAVIFGGVAAASVLGVPTGAVIGEFADWRLAFGAMAGFSLLVLVFVLRTLPALPAGLPVRAGVFLSVLSRRSIRLGLVVAFLFVSGHFMAFTFVRPALQTIAGVGAGWIGIVLFAYGMAGIAGNFLTGAIISRGISLSLITIGFMLTVSIAGLAAFATAPRGGIMILILWGLAYGGVSVALQTVMMRAAPAAVETATSLYVSVFNGAIAFGSFAGGVLINRYDLQKTLAVAAALTATGLLFVLIRDFFVHRHIDE